MIINLSPENETDNELYRIHDGSFPFPDLSDNTYILKKVVISDGQLVGCGLVRITSECTLMLDKSASLKRRVIATQELQNNMINELKKKGIKDVHAFMTDEKVFQLVQHLGFKPCPEKYVASLRFGYE